MFPSNPFLVAAEQFIDAATTKFALVDTQMIQSTNGSVAVQVSCYLDQPPSPYGWLTVTFTFRGSEWEEHRSLRVLRNQDEAEGEDEDPALADPDEEPSLFFEAVYTPGTRADNDEDTYERCWEIVQSFHDVGKQGSTVVDRCQRRSTSELDRAVDLDTDDEPKLESYRISVRQEGFVPLTDVHGRDWANLAAEWWMNTAALAQATCGSAPDSPIDFSSL